MTSHPIPVHVLVDWNIELLALKANEDRKGPEVARRVFKLLNRHVGKMLYDMAGLQPFSTLPRLLRMAEAVYANTQTGIVRGCLENR